MVTQKDIAQKLNIRQSIVSAVLNDCYYPTMRISERKRSHIKQVAGRMGYKIDEMARTIRTGKSKVIGLITNGVPENMAYAINLVAERESFIVKSFILSRMGSRQEERMANMMDIIIRQRLAGVLIHYGCTGIETLIAQIQEKNIPCVVLNTLEKVNDNISHFYPDDKSGGAMAAGHFLQLGHSNFICIGHSKENHVEKLRIDGFVETVRKSGKKIPAENIIQVSDVNSRMKRLKTLLSNAKNFPLAIFSANSYDSINALTACLASGFKVPGDISIAGYGNHALASSVTPSITSIRENHFKRTVAGTDHLFKLINKKAKAKQKIFNPQIIARDSSAECRKANKNL